MRRALTYIPRRLHAVRFSLGLFEPVSLPFAFITRARAFCGRRERAAGTAAEKLFLRLLKTIGFVIREKRARGPLRSYVNARGAEIVTPVMHRSNCNNCRA